MDTVRGSSRLSQVLQPPAPTAPPVGPIDSVESSPPRPAFYEPPLRAHPAFTLERLEPVSCFGGRFHRQATALAKAMLKASADEAAAQLLAYFSQGKKAATPEGIARKMHYLIYFAARQGPDARRQMERLLAPHMRPATITYVAREVKHRIYSQCARGAWGGHTLAEVEHLLLLRAAQPQQASVLEQAETWELRRMVELRVQDQVAPFYAALLKMATRPDAEVEVDLLFRTLQNDIKVPAARAHAEAVLEALSKDCPMRDAVLKRCMKAQDTALALRFFCSANEQEARNLAQMLRARGRLVAGCCNGFYVGGHPYHQLVKLLQGSEGRLYWQLLSFLTACISHDLSAGPVSKEELIRWLAPIKDPTARLRMLQVANAHRVPALVAALVGDGEGGLRVPVHARALLPGAIMATRRKPFYVALGDAWDRVILETPGVSPLSCAAFDLARLQGEHRLDEQAFSLAVRDLGFVLEDTTTEPVAHHVRQTESGVEHTLLRRIAVPGDGKVHATLRCKDAASMLPLLRSGNWEAKTLSASSDGELVVAALHTDLPVDQEILVVEPKKLVPTLCKRASQGWRAPSGYVLPSGKHRVLLTRAKSDSALDAPRGFLARLVRSDKSPPPAPPAPPESPKAHRKEADYANDERFFDGSSVSHIEPEDFVQLAGGEKPYAFHVLDLVGAIVSKAKQLRDARQDVAQAWHNPLTRAPLRLPEVESLRAHRHGWALRDLPLPEGL